MDWWGFFFFFLECVLTCWAYTFKDKSELFASGEVLLRAFSEREIFLTRTFGTRLNYL